MTAAECALEAPDADGFPRSRDLVRGHRAVLRVVDRVWLDPGTAVEIDGRSRADESPPGFYTVVVVPSYMVGDTVSVRTVKRREP